MNNTLKEWFFEILKKTDLYYTFLSHFGNGEEESCLAKDSHLEGWFFTEDEIIQKYQETKALTIFYE